jgi:N-acetylglucosamine malate deacetylase 2
MTAYHADGPGLATGTFLAGDHSVTTLELDLVDRLRKRRMINCFTSQREPLAGFGTEVERFRAAPLYDFERAPHPGRLHYERLGWSITGEVWRHQARQAVEELGLRSPAWA